MLGDPFILAPPALLLKEHFHGSLPGDDEKRFVGRIQNQGAIHDNVHVPFQAGKPNTGLRQSRPGKCGQAGLPRSAWRLQLKTVQGRPGRIRRTVL